MNRKRYEDRYTQEEVLHWLKSGSGNLTEFQRTKHPEMPLHSVYSWMEWQNWEFRIECRKYYPNTKKQAAKTFCLLPNEQKIARIIYNQKKWRESLPNEPLELIKGRG